MHGGTTARRDAIFPSPWVDSPSYLQMWTSAARGTVGVTTSATTPWAATAAPVTRATCWWDVTCATVSHKTPSQQLMQHKERFCLKFAGTFQRVPALKTCTSYCPFTAVKVHSGEES